MIEKSLEDIKHPSLTLTQKLVHCVAIIIGWMLYFWFLYSIMYYDALLKILDIVQLFIFVNIIIIGVSYAWIKHNIHLYEKKGPRTGIRTVKDKFKQDALGSIIHADIKAIKKARFINIQIKENNKFFKVMDTD